MWKQMKRTNLDILATKYLPEKKKCGNKKTIECKNVMRSIFKQIHIMSKPILSFAIEVLIKYKI